ncbi:hypothetical protein TSAR_012365 [Trichomalopsis sarcophagae]|uniref:Uncharacterized protein n=1 Tax=Trichomalopsis sarcophagae TaxID=543379 RepID=A0A232EFQ3_9HYME|nr:hypothetical protein TSAR_012365 [Trichomalopsis sarcophagae]
MQTEVGHTPPKGNGHIVAREAALVPPYLLGQSVDNTPRGKRTPSLDNMDSKAAQEEVKAAIERALGKLDNGRRLTSLKPNIRGVRMPM